jgi:rubrerythrin
MLNELLSQVPVQDNKKVTDNNILRQAIIAEYDAVSLYEQMSNSAKSEQLKKLLLDVAQEERVHIGEFEALLEKLDKKQIKGIKDGKKEFKSFQEFFYT